MDKLDLKVFPAGLLKTNNYLIFNKQSRKGFIVDFSESFGELSDFIKKEKIEIDFILLTHAHFDHIQGLQHANFPFYLHKRDCDLISDPDKNGSSLFSDPMKIDRNPKLYHGKINFYNSEIAVIDTPGHTPGSVSLKLNKWLFSGDTLFCNSVGRTDIPFASKTDLMESIQKKILVLPDDIIIYPGHGPSSTLGQEKETNPFLAI